MLNVATGDVHILRAFRAGRPHASATGRNAARAAVGGPIIIKPPCSPRRAACFSDVPRNLRRPPQDGWRYDMTAERGKVMSLEAKVFAIFRSADEAELAVR